MSPMHACVCTQTEVEPQGFLNQAYADQRVPGLLKLLSCVYVCVCVSTLEAINN